MASLAPSKSGEFDDKDWRIVSTVKGCLPSAELEQWQERLAPLNDLPEMLFGNNSLRLTHAPSGVCIDFNAYDALALVNKNECDVELVYSDAWQRSRTATGEAESIEHLKSKAKPYDWTFTAPYFGTLSHGQSAESSSVVPVRVERTEAQIDYERLKRPDPILYFNEVMLWEDELADNGSSDMRVKIRVMPSCYFVLLRLFIRVDHVMFRVIDTRLYHEFGTSTVLRDVQHREATYKQLGARLPRDPTKIGDMQHMVTVLPLDEEKSYRELIHLD